MMTDYCEVKIWCDFPTVVRVIHACTGEVRYYATECETCEMEQPERGRGFRCSSCGFFIPCPYNSMRKPMYCPECGARVVGGS